MILFLENDSHFCCAQVVLLRNSWRFVLASFKSVAAARHQRLHLSTNIRSEPVHSSFLSRDRFSFLLLLLVQVVYYSILDCLPTELFLTSKRFYLYALFLSAWQTSVAFQSGILENQKNCFIYLLCKCDNVFKVFIIFCSHN